MSYSNKKYAAVISLCLLFELAFLYYIKYSNQNLNLAEFSLNNIGNIINLSVTLVLIIGVILYFKNSNSTSFPIFIMLLLSIAAEIALYISTLIDIPGKEIYIFGQEGNKLIDAAVFTVYYFIIFIFTSIVWLNVFGFENSVFIKSIVNGVLIIFFFLAATCIFIQADGNNSKNQNLIKNRKNVGVVLGAAVWSDNQPSPSLSGRVDKAVELYNDGYIGKILLTGGNAPGEMTEAEVAYEYAKKIGMEMSDVSYEPLTTSTIEQVRFVKSNLVGSREINDIILISDDYHLVRVTEICRFFNFKTKVAASDLQLNDGGKIFRQLRECIALTVFWCFAL